MTARKIVAVFDTSAAAQAARTRLIERGIPGDRITITDQNTGERKLETPHARGSFWAHIKEMFMPDHDRHTYEESMRRGGCMLVASVDDAIADQAIACLESAGAIDLEERESQWRSEGWQPTVNSPVAAEERTSGGRLNETTDRDIARGSDTTVNRDMDTTGAAATPTRTAGSAMLDDDSASERIPVVEERLRVGKREVNRGSVRVRSYIVEEPVHEEVRLREEHVNVERRRIDEPARPVVRGSGEDLLQERTIEVSETAEQAVVGKEARVTEQVVVGKSTNEGRVH